LAASPGTVDAAVERTIINSFFISLTYVGTADFGTATGGGGAVAAAAPAVFDDNGAGFSFLTGLCVRMELLSGRYFLVDAPAEEAASSPDDVPAAEASPPFSASFFFGFFVLAGFSLSAPSDDTLFLFFLPSLASPASPSSAGFAPSSDEAASALAGFGGSGGGSECVGRTASTPDYYNITNGKATNKYLQASLWQHHGWPVPPQCSSYA
jgi:hypothetical protein